VKKFLPFIIVGVIIVVSIFGFRAFSGKEEEEALSLSGTLPESSSGGSATKEFSGSLKAVMALGVPMKCTWKRDNNYFGASWVKGKDSYGEITMEGRNVKVIYKDNCMWNWQEGNSQGMKMCFDPVEMEKMLEGESVQGQDQSQGMPADIDYRCAPAVFTEAKFNPPAGVNFMDLEDMMGQ